ncbi:DNA translocase FtsK [Planomicrobium sp. CPCC 101110]|uniref:DNA translocase FtsK n=1 Tax=Planomicrobium sp. CPCC 101110 TaxID=2599619 RepID=UPI0011B6E4F8|nr:DNA translocase FtsK [Planomicrobium sp. CPCC 101110]TWT26406.1 DUF87 domain-containing protein [Planomicrobium sp. CPCC 101110]
MGWVKNIWKRMFSSDIEEENTQMEWEQSEPQQAEPTPFRFPLIPDDEIEVFLKRDATLVKVEASIKQETPPPFEPPARKPAVSPAQKPFVPATEKRIAPPVRKPQKTAAKPINKTRPFEPTRVPSPVYGFDETRPAPIENLLERKEIRFEPKKLPAPMALRNSVQKYGEADGKSADAPAVEEKTAAAVEAVKARGLVGQGEPVMQEPSMQGSAAEAAKSAVQEKPAAEQPETAQEAPPAAQEPAVQEEAAAVRNPAVEENSGPTQKPDAEEEPVLVQEFAEQAEPENKPEPDREEIEQAKEAEQSVHKEIQKENTEIEKTETAPEKKRERTVPFNVLMLKSDKERLKKTAPAAAAKPAKQEIEETKTVEPAITAEVASAEPGPAEGILPSESEPSLEKVEEKPAAYLHPENGFLLAPEDDRKDDNWMEEQGERLVEALSHFQIQASILSIVQGPAVTQFELTVAQGVKVSKIRNLADDLKLALAAKDIRIQAPIPGKSSIGIEIPNRTSRAVRISEIIDSPVFRDSDSPMEAALGLDLTGKPVTLDLRKMPHGLIAGATGSGKSVCINSLLVSLLYKSSPKDLKLLLIDPKMVELAPYNHIPHLVSPVITDVKAATASLKWAVEEMERRYQLFAHVGVRDISRYNKMAKDKGDHAQHLPYILIIIDELADLMMMSPSDVEDAICRIAQKARACGIHLVIATQRPSVDVITGLIKSNIPTRIAFSVSSQVDSRTILDSQGAERLLGRGDMLYLGNGMSAPVRLQGTFVTDEEIEAVIEHVRAQGKPEYFFKEEELMKRNHSPGEQDDLFEEACRFILAQGTASTSLLQRKFHIGYNRAARLMDLLEDQGFISEQNGSKARSVLITADDMEEVFH